MSDDPRIPVQAATVARRKRRNAVLALYDAPLHRDWAFWMTAGWGLMTAVAIPSGDQPSSLPVWLDTLLAVLTFVILFGVFPTWLRLIVRRWLERRQRRSPGLSAGRPTASPADTPVAFTRRQPPSPSSRMPPPGPDRGASGQGASAPDRVHQRGVPLNQDSTEPLLPSAPWTDARHLMPHPVARAVRTLQQAHTSKEQFEAVLDAAEILAISVSVTAAAFLRGGIDGRNRAGAHDDEGSRRLLSMLRSSLLAGGSATFGTWTKWLEAVRPFTASHPDAVPGLSQALHSDPLTPGLVEHLNALRNERNRAAHGDRPQSASESALRVTETRPHLEKALTKAEFLTRLPWLLTVSCAYRPKTSTFDVVAHNVMGDHPDFERREFTWPIPVANDEFHVLGPEGPLTLAPFVASVFCAQCQQMEVCYAARAGRNEGPATLKSFARGHTVHSPELGDEVRSLPVLRRGTGNAVAEP